MLQTTQDVTINFKHYGNIVVPKGTKCTNLTAMGIDKKYNFVDDFRFIDRNYPAIASVLKHDANYYGIDIPKQFVADI